MRNAKTEILGHIEKREVMAATKGGRHERA